MIVRTGLEIRKSQQECTSRGRFICAQECIGDRSESVLSVRGDVVVRTGLGIRRASRNAPAGDSSCAQELPDNSLCYII